jgi:hypothetical protein
MTTPLATRRAAERWFLDRGLPSVLTRRARLRSVWSRSAPALTGYAVMSACSLVIFLLTGNNRVDVDGEPTVTEWIVLFIVAIALPLAAIGGWVIARMVTDRSQAIASAVSVVFVEIAESIADGVFGGLVTVAVVVLILALTALGIGSIIGWAIRFTMSQFAAAGALLIRALPIVLLTVLVFFNTYVWVMSATISQTRMWCAIVLLTAIAAIFVVAGVFEQAKPLLQKATAAHRHTKRLDGTPFEAMPEPPEPDPLTTGEWFNVVFILAASQIAQILMVALVTASLFFALGMIVLSPELLAAWTRNGSPDGQLFGLGLPVPQALINMTLFLAALTFMYISARAVGDGEYRTRFLDPSIDDLKLTLHARNRYHYSSRASAPDQS